MDICTKQYELIRTALVPLINNDYIFIDLPYYSNIGDSLIWKGTETLLATLPYKCLYKASCKTFKHIDIPENVIIIMMGGGNWGDLYLIHNEFRRKIVQSYPNNKIVILPQTIYYEGARNARFDAKVFRKHKRLTIFARDKYSYWFLKLFRFGKNIRLLPDMAFCIDRKWLSSLTVPTIGKDLLFQRTDKEKPNPNDAYRDLTKKEYDISDWPLYGQHDPMLTHLNELIAEGKMEEADDYATNTYLQERIKTGVRFISQYDHVYSNRLHGAILSILLGKETYIIDNSYGKNSQFYDTWLKDTDGVTLLKRKKESNIRRKLRFVYHWLKSQTNIISLRSKHLQLYS